MTPLRGIDYGTGFPYHFIMSALSLSEARRRLFPLVRQVNDNAEVVQIGSGDDTAFLVPADMWRSISETAYLLKSPVNAARLRDAIADADGAVNQVHKHIDSLSEVS
jgi:antitoxin YefM